MRVEITFMTVVQALYSLTRTHLVDDHLFPLITGHPPEVTKKILIIENA